MLHWYGSSPTEHTNGGIVMTSVAKVGMSVDEPQSALDFWIAAAGFQLVRDESCGSERRIEAKPPRQEHFGWGALFEDGEGTRYPLGQRDGSRS